MTDSIEKALASAVEPIVEDVVKLERKLDTLERQPGPQGEPGRDADPVEVAKHLAADPVTREALRGPEGPKGDAGPQGETGIGIKWAHHTKDTNTLSLVLTDDTEIELELPEPVPGEKGDPGSPGADGLGLDAPVWKDGVHREGAVVQHHIGQVYRALKDTAQEPGTGDHWERVGTGGLRWKGGYKKDANYEHGDVFVKDFCCWMVIGDTPRMIAKRGDKGEKGDTPKAEDVVAELEKSADFRKFLAEQADTIEDVAVSDEGIVFLKRIGEHISVPWPDFIRELADKTKNVFYEGEDDDIPPIRRFAGIFETGQTYRRGDLLAHGQSLLVCLRDGEYTSTTSENLRVVFTAYIGASGGGGLGGGLGVQPPVGQSALQQVIYGWDPINKQAGWVDGRDRFRVVTSEADMNALRSGRDMVDGTMIYRADVQRLFSFVNGHWVGHLAIPHRLDIYQTLAFDPENTVNERLEWKDARIEMESVRTRAQLNDRTTLPPSHLARGKLVYVQDEQKMFELVGDPLNLTDTFNDWDEIVTAIEFVNRYPDLPHAAPANGMLYVIRNDLAGNPLNRLLAWDRTLQNAPIVPPSATVDAQTGSALPNPAGQPISYQLLLRNLSPGVTTINNQGSFRFDLHMAGGIDVSATVPTALGESAADVATHMAAAITALNNPHVTDVQAIGSMLMLTLDTQLDAVNATYTVVTPPAAIQTPPGNWRTLDHVTWVRGQTASADPVSDQSKGDLSISTEKDAELLRVWDGTAWRTIYSTEDVKSWMASLAQFSTSVQEVGGTLPSVMDFSGLPDLAALQAANDLSRVGSYYVYVGGTYTVQSADPRIGADLQGQELHTGDWLLIGNVGTAANPDLHWARVGGDTLTKARADGLYSLQTWQAGVFEAGALVTAGGDVYRAGRDIVVTDPDPTQRPQPLVVTIPAAEPAATATWQNHGDVQWPAPGTYNIGEWIELGADINHFPAGPFDSEDFVAGTRFLWTGHTQWDGTTDGGVRLSQGWALIPDGTQMPAADVADQITPPATSNPWQRVDISGGLKIANTEAVLPGTAPPGEVWIVLSSVSNGGKPGLFSFSQATGRWEKLGGGGTPLELGGGEVFYPEPLLQPHGDPEPSPRVMGDLLFAIDAKGTPTLAKVSLDGAAWTEVGGQDTPVGTTPPTAADIGDFWIDTTGGLFQLRQYDGTHWKSTIGRAEVTPTEPTPSETGLLWLDMSLAQRPLLKVWDGTNWAEAGERTPVGTIIMHASVTPPKGYMLCDGSAVPAGAEYNDLRAIVGLHVPDLRDQFIRGAKTQAEIDGFSKHQDTTRRPRHTDFTGSTNSRGDHTHRAYTWDQPWDHSGGDGDPIASADNRRWGQYYNGRSMSTDGAHTHSVTINGGGDTETAPAHVRLAFHIKAL